MVIVQALGWYFPESLGGTEVYVAALSSRLHGRGHRVLVAAPDPVHPRERRYWHDGIEVYRYPIPAAPLREHGHGGVPVAGSERFHAWIDKLGPDVFHAHSFVTGLGLAELRAARAAGARVVVTCHTPGLGYLCHRGTMMRWGQNLCDGVAEPSKCASCVLQAHGLPQPVARLLGSVPVPLAAAMRRVPGAFGAGLGMSALIAMNQARQQAILDATDHFVLLTDWARRAVAANDVNGQRPTSATGTSAVTLSLNRLGIETVRFPRKGRVRKPDEPLRLGYLGRFDEVKGVLQLARAFTRLPAELSFTMEFRGPCSSPAEKAVLEQVRRLVGGDPRVRFREAVAPERAGDVLSGWDLLLCPANCLEGGPTVALEARAVGTPVLGTDIGGLAETIRDGVDGRLVPPGDVAALAGAMEEVVRDPTSTIDAWRHHLPRSRSMDDVAADYMRMYLVSAREDACP